MTDHLRGATEMVPTPPSRAALAAVLAQAAEDEPLLADRPVPACDWATQRVDLANGWQLWVWWQPDLRMGRLNAARTPDGGNWTFGCDRWPDWEAGPAAVTLDPLQHLITAEQREQLRQRLLTCNCWPDRELPPRPEPPSMDEIDRLYPFDLMAS